MSVISGYNCTQKEAAICEACDQAIDDSYVIKLLNETMGPQTVSTFFIDTYLYDNICSAIWLCRCNRIEHSYKKMKWCGVICSKTWMTCLWKYYRLYSRIIEFKTDIEDMSFKLCLSSSSKNRILVIDKSIKIKYFCPSNWYLSTRLILS